uniref:Uncharacterized protein n=1 Tax=Chromera velia CCMP2878 TaxID=1169474 RepID=A0A0G4FAF4_9ALVE|eukprot:Cvel_16035.t1-p1 / transcript=Cvel_16035.t1 / gene=Cvel_16035 / organism=Chromera_velia_CCMP2878 / gene_product=hypothetical protein / transcript_product=hypothetical protein / location=Cvel_scaffold1217:41495-46580(+) / protein_length=864 / sequence_SO=supercontig / SO=protein_coding / is_pseudo=false
MERLQVRDNSLFVTLKRSGLCAETISELAKQKDSFGLAWVCCQLYTKNKEKWNVSVDPPRALDLSDTFGLSAKKIFFFLEGLPDSVEEVKLGPAAVQGRALPLFVRFLERHKAATERGGQRRLKSYAFAGNLLGIEGFRTLAKGIRRGKAASLRVLDLEETGSGGLQGEGLTAVWEAIKENHGLRVEELNLSGNAPASESLFSMLSRPESYWAEQEAASSLASLCSVLSVSSLPCLRVLFLKNCGLSESQMQQIVSVLVEGGLPDLEGLDLGENEFSQLSGLASALRGESLTHLKNLNLMKRRGTWLAIGISDFLSALRAEECPPLLHVAINFENLTSEKDLQALGGGLCPAVRSLGLYFSPAEKAATFFRALVESAGAGEGDKGGRFDVLDVGVQSLMGGGDEEFLCECLRLLGKGIRGGQLGFLRKVAIERQHEWRFAFGGGAPEEQRAGRFGEAKSLFFSALKEGEFVALSEISFHYFQLSDAEMVLLGEAVKGGCLSNLRVLDLQSNGGAACFGREGMEALMKGVVESDEGLPLLETLNLADTRAGEGGGCLGAALLSGKLPRLSSIHLNNSCLTDEGVRGLGDAVRGGGLLQVTFLNFMSNPEVSEGAWMEFLNAIRQSERGLPKLTTLNLYETKAINVGGSMAEVLGSGKLPALQNVDTHFFQFSLDTEGVGQLADALREGKFPQHLCEPLTFGLHPGNVNVDPLITAIGESEKGLPPFLHHLHLRGGRVGEEALGSLAASAVGGSGGKLKHLQLLNVYDCALDDNSLRRLGEVFSKHGGPKLSTLYLSRNMITIEGLKAFHDVLRPGCLPNLEKFSILEEEGFVKEEESALAMLSREILHRATGKSQIVFTKGLLTV